MSRGSVEHPPQLAGTLLLLICVWTALLLCQVSLEPRLGRPTAVLVSFALASALVLATRGPRAARPTRSRALAFGAGVVAGLSSYPGWIALIAGVGTALGLERPAPPARPGAVLTMAAVLLAPVFEELLYRERLLEALRRRTGPAAAILLSSAAFAATHVEPWAILGTFLVGLGLGTVMCVSGTVAPCIGLHAGLNLAAWLAA